MVRTNQGGSILGFVIIGGVMALLLVGGAYLVRHNLNSTSDGAPIAVENDTEPEQPADDDAVTPDEEQPDAQEEQDDASQDSTASDEQSPSVHADTGSPEHLPQTGPGETIVGALLLGSIAGAAVAYKRSRDAIASL